MSTWSIVKTIFGSTVKVATTVVITTGKVVTTGTVKAAEVVYENRETIGKAAAKATDTLVTGAAVIGYGTYKATEWTAKKIYDHREEIGGATVGAARDTANAIADSTGHFLSFKPKVERINAQSVEYKRRIGYVIRKIKKAKGHVNNRDILLDNLAVGGATLAAYADGSANVPDKVEQAFEAAYPGLAENADFGETVRYMHEDELQGLASGVKGKLFEIEYVDYLNDGHLPDGYAARIADSATQPGWDIKIIGPDEQTTDIIQAKATDSVSYVKEALEKYPHIDVVTTSEVHSQLVMQGFSEDVIDSGISEVALQTAVDTAAGGANVSFDWMPSTLSLALIAFSSYSKKDLSEYEKSKNFGERASKSYLAYLAGGALAVATNTWWIGLIGGLGTRLIIGNGRKKWERKSQLDQLIKNNDAVLARLPKPR